MTNGWDSGYSVDRKSTDFSFECARPSTPLTVGFYGGNSFGSPTGRAIGIGHQQEVVARLKDHTLGYFRVSGQRHARQ